MRSGLPSHFHAVWCNGTSASILLSSRHWGRFAAVEVGVELMDDVEAVAGGRSQSVRIEDGDFSTAVSDEPAALEGASDHDDGGALGAEHLGEDFLGEMQGVLLYAVADHEEPAGEAGFCLVQLVAGGELGDGEALLLDELEQAGADFFGSEEEVADFSKRDAPTGGLHLDEAADGRRGGTEDLESADHAFASDKGDLGDAAFLELDDEAGDAGGDEVGVLGRFIDLEEGGADGEGDVPGGAQDEIAAFGGEGVEELVGGSGGHSGLTSHCMGRSGT